MHKYANAGPVMQGLAAMVEIDPPIEPMPQAGFAPRMSSISVDDLVSMIQNVADQMSEIAAQLVDVRKRLDAIERPPFVGPSVAEMLAQQQRMLQQQSVFGQYSQTFGSKLG